MRLLLGNLLDECASEYLMAYNMQDELICAFNKGISSTSDVV